MSANSYAGTGSFFMSEKDQTINEMTEELQNYIEVILEISERSNNEQK